MIHTSINESSNQQPETIEHLSPVAARMMLAAFPAHIQQSFERRAKEINYPIEAVLVQSSLNLGTIDRGIAFGNALASQQNLFSR